MKNESPPKEVEQMRTELADVRKRARGVKDSARSMRSVPRSDRFSAITAAAVAAYDEKHPSPSRSDEPTRRT